MQQNKLQEKKQPREGKAMVQEYYCICFQMKNNKCTCAVGPFKDADRESMPEWYRNHLEGCTTTSRPTVSDNVGPFMSSLLTGCVEVRYILGII